MRKNLLFLVFLLLGIGVSSYGQAPITGPTDACVGSTITLLDASPGGTWSSSTGAVATVGSVSGIVTGVFPGTTTISYTVGVGTVTTVVTIHPNPAPIFGLTVVCQGATITLTDATGLGSWTSSSTGVATVTGGGVVTGVSAGTTVISYTVGFCSATTVVTVNPNPAPITLSAPSVCIGYTVTATDATVPGTWSSSAGAIAGIVAGTGVITGVSFGTAVISYTLATGCYATATMSVNVNPGPITGFAAFCQGSTATYADGGTGAWTSSNTAVATIDVVTGVTSGVAIGTTVLTYTFTTGCFVTRSISIANCSNICPPNVDFEFGDPSYWTYATGTCTPSFSPYTYNWTGAGYTYFNRHELTWAGMTVAPGHCNAVVGGVVVDKYGGFPVVGGGSYSMRIGSETTGFLTDRATYFIHVPAGSTNYSLIYRYAVVLEDPPSHAPYEKPRFEVNVYDSATGTPKPCDTFKYVAGALPGFLTSTVQSPEGLYPFYHAWATSSINLSGSGGTTVRVDFTSGDCGQGGHFGYGYLDMTCGLFGINAIACNDTNVTLTAPSGFASYSWYDSSTFAPILGTTQTVILPMPSIPTTYAVIIAPYTGFGCPDTLYTRVIPSLLKLHKMHDTTVCLGSSVNLTSGATDIALPLSYAWTPSGTLACSTCATPVATPATIGTVMYTFTVTDAANCHATDSIKVTTNGVIIYTTSVNATCHGFDDGSAAVHITTGVAPYTYAWTTFPVQTTSGATNLTAGTYSVTVTDNDGCTATAPVTITDSAAFTLIIDSANNPTTCGGVDGKITLGGVITPSTLYRVTYLFNGVRVTTNIASLGVGSTLIIPGLGKGTYDSITFVRGGCQYNFVGPVILRDPPLPAPPVLTSNSPVCLGSFIRTVATDLTDSVSYFWTGPPGTIPSLDDTDLISGASYALAGYYVVTVTKHNCVVTDSIKVDVIANPLPRGGSNSAICSGDTLKLTSYSLNGATSYLWHGPASFHSRFQNPEIPNATTALSGPFVVYVTLNGCTDSTVVNVVVNQTPAAPLVQDTAYCQYDNVTGLNVTGTGLRWYNDPTGGINIYPAPPVPSTLVHGKTTWYVSQSIAGCEGPRAPVSATVYNMPKPSIDLLDTVVCRGSQLSLNAISIGEANTGITWNFDNGDSVLNENPVMHSFDAEGVYMVYVRTYYKTCPSVKIGKKITVFAYPNLYLGEDTAICPGGEPLVLADQINAANPLASWVWSTGDIGSQLVVKKAGAYYAIVTINGCSSTDTVMVRNDCYMDIPNVFTPNGDGVNDYFYPRQYLTKGLMSFKMDIYNRWGQLIYETATTDGRGWDGTFNNIPQPEGVYIYKIDAVFKDGQQEHHQGNITLLK